jgi:hypothetical protein
MAAPIIKGPRALAMHLRKLLRECGVNGPWLVRRTSTVEKCADEWCVDISITNADTGATRFAIIGVRAPERIHVAADEPEASIVRNMLCDCLAAEGIEARVFCGKRG